jgi:hypothetical protein
MRADDHRFSSRQKLSFATVLSETSWFFCAPAARQDFLAKAKAHQDQNAETSSMGKKTRRAMRRSQKNKHNKDNGITVDLPALALHPFSRASLSLVRWRRITKIACGAAHAAFLSGVVDGHVLYTSGDNVHGQLGHGDRKSRLRPTPVHAFMHPCARAKGKSRRAHKVIDVACGPNYTIAVVFHAFKGRFTVFSWGKSNAPEGSFNLDHIRAPLRQGKIHPLTFVRRLKGKKKEMERSNTVDKKEINSDIEGTVVSLATDVLCPLQVIRFTVPTERGGRTTNPDHAVLKPFILHSEDESVDRKIGHESFQLPIDIMPMPLGVYFEEAFETWLRHSESMTGSLWNSLSRNAEYEIAEKFLEPRSKTRLSNHLAIAGTSLRRSMQLELKVVREAIDSLDRTIGIIGAAVGDIIKLDNGDQSPAQIERIIKGISGQTTIDGGRIFGKLGDEVLDLLAKATKARDACLFDVNNLKEQEAAVSSVLFCLGQHRDRIGNWLSRLRSGGNGQISADDDTDSEEEDDGAVVAPPTTGMRPERMPLEAGVSRLQLLAAASTSHLTSSREMRGTPSTRFDVVVDGVPTAADEIRRGIESGRAYDIVQKRDGSGGRGVGASGNGKATTNEPLRSWFDETGEPIETCILLLVDIGAVGGRGLSKDNGDRSGTGKRIESASQCKQELKWVNERVGEISRCRLLLHSELRKYEQVLAGKNDTLMLVQNIVQDVQSVERVDAGQSQHGASKGGSSGDSATGSNQTSRPGGGGSPGFGQENELSVIVNDLVKLWSDGVLSMDDSLAQVFLQTNLDRLGNSMDAMLGEVSAGSSGGGGSGGGGKSAVFSVPTPSASASAKGNTGGRLGVLARNMQSYGLLSSSRVSLDLLSATQANLQKIMLSCEHMPDTNQSYPAMLMLEMVSDCVSMRVSHQVAVAGIVQQSHDAICAIFPGFKDLPILMPDWDLTYTEFTTKLQVEFSDRVEDEITELSTIEPGSDPAMRRKFEGLFDLVRDKICHELDESYYLNGDTKALRVNALEAAIRKAKACDLGDDAELGEKLLRRLVLAQTG